MTCVLIQYFFFNFNTVPGFFLGTEMSHPANRLTSLKNFGQHCEVKRNSFKKSLAFLGNGNLIGAATITSNSTTVTNTMATARGDGGCVGAKNPGQQQKVCKSSLKGMGDRERERERCDEGGTGGTGGPLCNLN